jgi:hypothetical protein
MSCSVLVKVLVKIDVEKLVVCLIVRRTGGVKRRLSLQLYSKRY